MNVIIIAALAIIVLIVLAVIFSGRVKLFGQGLKDCEAQGGDCSGYSESSCRSAGGAVIPNTDCTSGVCCILTG